MHIIHALIYNICFSLSDLLTCSLYSFSKSILGGPPSPRSLSVSALRDFCLSCIPEAIIIQIPKLSTEHKLFSISSLMRRQPPENQAGILHPTESMLLPLVDPCMLAVTFLGKSRQDWG